MQYKRKSNGKTFEYNAQLVAISEDTLVHPSVLFLRNTETQFRYCPAQFTNITEAGVVHGFNVPMVMSRLLHEEVNITYVPSTDLHYFGLKVHALPTSVFVKGTGDIKVKGALAQNGQGYIEPVEFA